MLRLENLTLGYERSRLPIVEDVNLSVSRGEIVALVGESGCGKSLTGLSLLRLLPPGIVPFSGRIVFHHEDLLSLPEDELRRFRGGHLAMIFQDPMTALNPVFTVGFQIVEALELHRGLKGARAQEEAVRLLAEVGIPAPKERFFSYPHELSGGMRQRVMIAMALAGEPELLIADEPTTALDVTIQAQILELLRGLRESRGLSILLISHDLGVVAELADRVAVMYAGRLVEEAPVEELYQNPLHPYTRALLEALPTPEKETLSAIPGRVPSPGERPPGCKFSDRCSLAQERCFREEPALLPRGDRHLVRCHLV
ncbi:MAG: ABC transporter ATP-binding protein [Thermodesulfobacteria bacterium]|nr:ABC transporter ATP-binding protein [Thermodesulfobacteriota bacterium]